MGHRSDSYDMRRYPARLCVLAALTVFAVMTGCAAVSPDGRKMAAANGKNVEANGVVRPANPGVYYPYLVARSLIKSREMEAAAGFLETAVRRDPASVLLKHELALVYVQTNRKEEALALCRKILDIQPDHVDALIIAASIEQSRGEGESAGKLYERVLEISPERKNIYLVLGRIYFQNDLLEKAKQVFERLLEHYPDSHIGYYYMGRIFADSGGMERAAASFRRSVEIDPGFTKGRLELIDIYENKGETRKIMDLYEEILEGDPENVSAAIALGLLYRKNGMDEKAEALFRGLGRRAETDSNVVHVLARDLIEPERHEEASAVIGKMLAEVPESADLHYLAGLSEYFMERYAEALSHFREVGGASRFYADAVIQSARIYHKKQQQDKAFEILAGVLDHPERLSRSENVRIVRFLGALYIDGGKFGEAIDILGRGLSVDPENPDLHFELGLAYDQKGERGKTLEHMEMVISKDPEHAEALNYIGYTYAEDGIHLDEAEELIRRALEIQPDSGHILDSMGWVYYKKEEFDKAVYYLEKAVEKRPGDPVILEHLGDAYLKQNRKDKALDFYRRALLAKEGDARPEKNDDDRAGIKAKIEQLTSGE